MDLRVRLGVRRGRADPRYAIHTREYEGRFGFGHSSTDHVAVFAEKADVDRLVLFHHDPMHNDAELDEMRLAVIDRWESIRNVAISRLKERRSSSDGEVEDRVHPTPMTHGRWQRRSPCAGVRKGVAFVLHFQVAGWKGEHR